MTEEETSDEPRPDDYRQQRFGFDRYRIPVSVRRNLLGYGLVFLGLTAIGIPGLFLLGYAGSKNREQQDRELVCQGYTVLYGVPNELTLSTDSKTTADSNEGSYRLCLRLNHELGSIQCYYKGSLGGDPDKYLSAQKLVQGTIKKQESIRVVGRLKEGQLELMTLSTIYEAFSFGK